jgi:predicted dehydrogenase
MPLPDDVPASSSRRHFLKTSTLAAAGALAGLGLSRSVHAAGSDVLKVGLIGCGGRGTGAAANALNADPQAKITALADVFPEKVENSLKGLKAQYKERVDVPPERCFTGFDAYQKLIQSGVDVVLLAEPPHFRPRHLKAAVEAGKHVFCEKPVAVDGPGVRSVLETCKLAEQKGLSVVSGLCWRYHNGVRETMKRVLDGAIGDILAIQETYLTGFLWERPRKPEWSEMEFQMRNWYYFTWLSGDFNVEQHVHSLDKALWAMHDEPPARAWGLGGRQVRTDKKFGNIYDHHAVVYEYANGVRVSAFCRQQGGCYSDVSDIFIGTKGRCNVLKHQIEDLAGKTVWKFQGEGGNMYDLEHQALFAAIRAGKPINNGVYMARSTMLAILGRMVDYTGKLLTWDEAINSKEVLAPSAYSFEATPPVVPGPDGSYPIAMPGQTKFV